MSDKVLEYVAAACVVILAVIMGGFFAFIAVYAVYGLYSVGFIVDAYWLTGGFVFWRAIVFTHRLMKKNDWM